MKNYLELCIVMTLYAVMFCGCHSEITGTSSFYGSVNVTPSTAKNGDLITLKISPAEVSGTGMTVGIGTNSTINGKNVVKSIVYYIDGHKVAESSDYVNNYTVTYSIDNLSVGEHEVGARCTRNFKDIDIDEHITPYKLTISL